MRFLLRSYNGDCRHSKRQYCFARTVVRNVDMLYNTISKVSLSIIYFYPYKISIVQELCHTDHNRSLMFAFIFLASMEVDDAWPWKIVWGDENNIYRNGFANTQNFEIWDNKSTQMYLKNSLMSSPYVWLWFYIKNNCRFILL